MPSDDGRGTGGGATATLHNDDADFSALCVPGQPVRCL